jgi:tetratricopeptide (TPR) repeat protein
MNDALYAYVKDTENPELNFNLALEYEKVGQTAAAISFFLRAADRTQDLDLAYECFLRMASCFNLQNNRVYTVRGLYQQAIALLPKRPEAYFLYGRYLGWITQYAEAYTMLNVGLATADFSTPELRTNVEYPGKYGLIFEKAVSAYWWGKNMESRKLFHDLVDDYWDVMTDHYKSMVESNITRLGSGPESQAFTYYFKQDHDKLRFNFKGSKEIERNYSQVYQDMFILSVLNGKKNGTYLEVGGADPFLGNNTFLLEQDYDWKGISLENDAKFIDNYKNNRKNPVLHTDALKLDYKKLLETHFETKEIDYLQLDIEPARNTFEVLLSIPFEEYKFAVITYEHDYYVDVTKSYRDKSRKYLQLMGYELVVNDVSPDGISNFEDWWVHPDLVDSEIIKVMKDSDDKTKKAKNYILSK